MMSCVASMHVCLGSEFCLWVPGANVVRRLASTGLVASNTIKHQA